MIILRKAQGIIASAYTAVAFQYITAATRPVPALAACRATYGCLLAHSTNGHNVQPGWVLRWIPVWEAISYGIEAVGRSVPYLLNKERRS
jgi:hypothetical protein